MDRTHSPIPQKSSSFTSSSREDKLRDSDRNLSLSSLHFHPISEDENNNNNNEREEKQDSPPPPNNTDLEIPDLASLSDEIDSFLAILLNSPDPTPPIPDTSILRFTALLDKQETAGAPDPTFLASVARASKLTSALSAFACHEPLYYQAMNQLGASLHQALSFLQDEFHSLLINDISPPKSSKKPPAAKRRPSFSLAHESPASPVSPQPDHQSAARLRQIASAMISAGYETECRQVYTVTRRNALDATLSENGFDKISIDDILRMPWESLESEIGSWTKAFRHAVAVSVPRERELCEGVFDGILPRHFIDGITRGLGRGLLIQLLTFAEAVSMAKRSAEKLFKVLDMYEALRDMIPKLEDEMVDEEVRMDLCCVRARLGEAAVFIFCDLEMSIKSDMAKAPVPSGAVHPLTRYVMNYLKYACEYKNTLEEVFEEHRKVDEDVNSGSSGRRSPLFASQVVRVMDLLNTNLESKAKLYKDLALSSIFMMNNGRYIVQKIKGSAEIKELLGETWCRKKSSDLRKYHKNYQRETWSKVLGCFKDEGLQVKGAVLKPVLKERFKSFNAMFEEIHKTQSGWLVSDEQLQSELRVSISAVVVPAYRSFLGRFSQYLDPGRQTEKYIKFGAEDLESYIEDLFDGNPTSMLKRRS